MVRTKTTYLLSCTQEWKDRLFKESPDKNINDFVCKAVTEDLDRRSREVRLKDAKTGWIRQEVLPVLKSMKKGFGELQYCISDERKRDALSKELKEKGIEVLDSDVIELVWMRLDELIKKGKTEG